MDLDKQLRLGHLLLNERKCSVCEVIKDLTDEEAKKLLTTIHSLLMDGVELAEPSVDSSYTGEPTSGSIAPATL